MRELMVKYSHGETSFVYHKASASMVNQVLKIIEAELVKQYGVYTWSLEQSWDHHSKGINHWYHIIGRDNGQSWIDATGKTPAKALFNFLPARRILADVYGIEK